jgi:predicted transcriptional regulator
MRETLLLSVRPVFADQIVAGSKTVELRRVRPTSGPGTQVLIYSTSPTMALVASALVDRIEVRSVEAHWPHVRTRAGIGKRDYRHYFTGAEIAVAIWLADVRPLGRSIALEELRERWPWFRPPQSYCYVRASIEPEGPLLAPRFGASNGTSKSRRTPSGVVPKREFDGGAFPESIV